jgi:AAA domain
MATGLTHVARAALRADDALPDVWPSLSARGVRFRRSQTAMVAGPPGGGKTALAVVLACKAEVPALYVCADTDQLTMLGRVLSCVTGEEFRVVESRLRHPEALDYYAEALASVAHVRFAFGPSPSLEDIADEVLAFDEVFGEPPHLIVIDSLYDVCSGEGDEWSQMRAAMKQMRHLARKTGAAVVVLHHTSESHEHPTEPPARRFIQGKVSAAPELVLTVGCDPGRFEYKVAVVKNRSGVSDPGALNPLPWWCDMSRMVLVDSVDEWKRSF